MRFLRTWFITCFVGVILTSCNQTTLLTANFGGDVVGTEPNKTLPGDPAGDEISYVSGLAYRMRVNLSPGHSGKALFYSGRRWNDPGVPGHSNWVSFKGASTTSKKNLTFSWFEKFSGFTSSSQRVLVDITNGSGTVMVRLSFFQDGRVVAHGSFTGGSDVTIGTINVENWNYVIVNADPETRKFKIYISRDGAENVERSDIPFLDYGSVIDFGASMRPSLSFQLDDSVGEAGKYIVESVNIAQNN